MTTSTVAEPWKNSNTFLIDKKADVKDLKNYRLISFLSVANKVFTKVIGSRIRTILHFNQPKDQTGFRIGHSKIDHIHTVNQVVEKCAECNQPFYIAFFDYETAFQSFEKPSAVMHALWNQGVDDPYAKIMEGIYSGSTSTIVLHKESNILIKKGVRERERYDICNAIHRVFRRGTLRPGLGRVGERS